MKKYSYEKKIEIKENECWWGGLNSQGIRMPITATSAYRSDCSEGCQGNSFNGIFTSNFGRYLVTKGVYGVSAENGFLTLQSAEEIVFGETQEKTLKAAYLAAAKLATQEDRMSVPEDLLLCPQFCTWTEMGINVTAEKTITYAQSIVDNGYDHKLLIIDDGWMKDYGDWDFNEEKFPDPKRTMDRLHELGFKVYLWLVPFVNKNVPDYEYLRENKALVRGADGEPKLKNWWNGDSYVLDLSNPIAKEWLKKKLDFYVDEYDVDGFKFDAGDTDYYSYDDVTYLPVTPADQCALYSDLAKEYEYSELRASFRTGGTHVIVRLSDKQRNWSDECGIGALVPNMIQAGLCCFPYSCADMIGGGVISDFEKPDSAQFDFELISRFCECSALMPCMQFSYAYWNRNEKIRQLFASLIDVHTSVKGYLSELIKESQKTCAPILRHLEYEFPHQGYEGTMSAFMLGEKYLVAPVVNAGQTEQTLRLPKGSKWKYVPSGEVFEGGKEYTVPAPIGTLPYFERID